jgi:hypothetical protein
LGLNIKKTSWYDNSVLKLASRKDIHSNTRRLQHHETLIIGVDIAKYKHVARAQDFRGLEFGAPFYFENTNTGFDGFQA